MEEKEWKRNNGRERMVKKEWLKKNRGERMKE